MIEVRNLTKAFGAKLAVNDLSFSVQRGEVLGFLGPNGAGKSTTMRMLTGFIPPTEGDVEIGGFKIEENPIAVKRLLGYLPENAPAYADMTVHGFLSFAAELRGFRGAEKERAVDRVVEMCFLGSVLQQSIETLSKGFRHRTCFAQSIIHDPAVLILDEPTDGLDPNQKHEVRTLIRQMGEKKAIIFSTHILEEVEAVCSRAIIIDSGRIVANGTPAELKQRSPHSGAVTVRIVNGDASFVRMKLGELSGGERLTMLGESPPAVRIYPRNNSGRGELAAAIGQLAAREDWQIE
ncbi:MAG TPA: ABC transporter ATP-binding protein, partial [Chthoniobacteraceae bacterium]|nr:ABC transporter ATP-binding protein [Chthoniobacteraceae bacterium]